jgi:hypothetical protein
MTRIAAYTLLLAVVAVILFAQTASVNSQSPNPQPSLNDVIQDVQRAEASGANQIEMEGLLTKLNNVVTLQNQLQNMNSEDPSRAGLIRQINSELAAVDASANQIQMVASQRTSVNHLFSYSLGVIGAVIATVSSRYGFVLWRKYRTKRAFQMRIVPK